MNKELPREVCAGLNQETRKARIRKICPICKKHFSVSPSLERIKTCSFSCGRKLTWKNKQYCEKQKKAHLGNRSHLGQRHSRESIIKMRQAHFGGHEKVIRKNGYFYVYSPDHPQAINGRIPEQTLIAEKALGRFLEPLEIVHHVNQIKTDNRNKNLLICSSAYHRSLHAKIRASKGDVQIPGVKNIKKATVSQR